MSRRTVTVLLGSMVLLVAVAALAEKNASIMIKLLRLEGKSQLFLLEASEVTMTTEASWNRVGESDPDSPTLEFDSAEARSLSFDLQFDTYESKEDVRQKFVVPLENLALVDPVLKRPPMVEATLGPANNAQPFRGVVESVSTKYTMFMPSGMPVRCTATVKVKAAKNLTTKKQSSPCP